MKIKFTRALLITILALIVFLATTFIPWLRESKFGDFLQGFSLGVGAAMLIATIHFYNQYKKEQNSATRI
ncbi:MAG TPA: hypothetical protein VIM89_06740 [Mucilaginibacter sp.]